MRKEKEVMSLSGSRSSSHTWWLQPWVLCSVHSGEVCLSTWESEYFKDGGWHIHLSVHRFRFLTNTDFSQATVVLALYQGAVC